ncbi:FkbM family methyltransferase [Sphingomonas sp. dw_22]|uniref:FkbM family methyltransferase n=1 Tax=Sphingomonas sp. dw_22 TaxID=2721175 RepID=UPI001BD3A0EA|nr:FkbM family methyltransferase [Sphingomonas sp. dw_22]
MEIWREAVSEIIANDNARMVELEAMWRANEADSNEINADLPATLADLWNCYRLLLNRIPDPIGAPHHLECVRDGISVHNLVKHFLFSQEHLTRYRQPVQQPDGPTRTQVNGLDLYLPAPQTSVERTVRETGRHKPHLAGAIASVLKQGMYVVDIGAGAGAFAVHAARKVGPIGRVVALEPHPEKMRALLANVTAHALDTVDVLPFAAADGDGFIALVTSDGVASARDASFDDLTNGDAPIVYARTLDSIIPTDQRVDFIVIALDGFDYRALAGARDILTRWRPHLIAEYAPDLLREYSGVDPADYLRLLSQAGYCRFTAISPEKGAIDLGSDVGALAALPDRLETDRIDFYAWSA